MTYCEQCGSTSHDEQGFCRGCGARLPGYGAARNAGVKPIEQAFQQQASAGGAVGPLTLAQPQVKNVWVAVLLGLFLGPLGMVYCTYLGAFVMLIAEIVSAIYCGKMVTLVGVPVACAVWAGLAARSANSIY